MNLARQNRLAQPGFHCAPNDKVNPTTEEALQKLLQAHVVVEGLPVELDEEIKVAAFGRFIPCRGTEQRQGPDPEAPYTLPVLSQGAKYLVTIACHATLYQHPTALPTASISRVNRKPNPAEMERMGGQIVKRFRIYQKTL